MAVVLEFVVRVSGVIIWVIKGKEFEVFFEVVVCIVDGLFVCSCIDVCLRGGELTEIEGI